MLFINLLIVIYHSKTFFSFSISRNDLEIYVPHSLVRYIGHFYSSKLFLCPLVSKSPVATKQTHFSESSYTDLHIRYVYVLL
jgi:hypothetical protein